MTFIFFPSCSMITEPSGSLKLSSSFKAVIASLRTSVVVGASLFSFNSCNSSYALSLMLKLICLGIFFTPYFFNLPLERVDIFLSFSLLFTLYLSSIYIAIYHLLPRFILGFIFKISIVIYKVFDNFSIFFLDKI